MPDTTADIYWDSCVFLAYVNGEEKRLPFLNALLESSAEGDINLYTSDLSRVEVAFAASEQMQRALDEEVERRINLLMGEPLELWLWSSITVESPEKPAA